MSREELQRALQEIIGTNYGKYQCHKETMIAAAWAINNVLLGAEKSISDFTDMEVVDEIVKRSKLRPSELTELIGIVFEKYKN